MENCKQCESDRETLIDRVAEFEESIKRAELIADYIFQHEQEDFYENPSRDHVYYLAYVFSEGIGNAEEILKEAKRALEQSVEVL